MYKIVVNGKEINCEGNSIIVNHDKIVIDGKIITENVNDTAPIEIYGDVSSIDSNGGVSVYGNVTGDIDCNGGCTVNGTVSGNIDANGSVVCGSVNGDISAGGSVVCNK